MEEPKVDLSIAALFRLIANNIKLLLGLGVVTIILSSVVSLLLTEYYKSTVIIFPAEINSLVLNESGVRRGNISDFGEEEEAEQMLQIINSEALQERMIERHDLYNHYEIDPEDRYARSEVRLQYNSNVTARRTKYNSVEISVIDKDAEMAALMANSISEFADSVKNRMIQERAKTSLHMLDEEAKRLQSALAEVNQKLHDLKAKGVVGEMERAGLYETLGNASITMARELQKQIKINQEFGADYDALARQRDIMVEQQTRFMAMKRQFLSDAQLQIPQKFVVDKAMIADKKAFPIRWLIVLGSLISVLLFATVMLILRENYAAIFQS